MKNTKNITNLKNAISYQHCDINFYRDSAESILRELNKGIIDRNYIYSKIKILQELEKF